MSVERAISLVDVAAKEMSDMARSTKMLRDDFTSITGHVISCPMVSKMVMCLICWDNVNEAGLVREIRIKHGYDEVDILHSIQAVAYDEEKESRNIYPELDSIVSILKSNAEYEIFRALED